VTPPKDWIAVDETLAAELRDRLAELGYEGALDKAFNDWAGTENLEERVEGVDRIDPVVLAALRDKSR
jgi:aminopeptidase N